MHRKLTPLSELRPQNRNLTYWWQIRIEIETLERCHVELINHNPRRCGQPRTNNRCKTRREAHPATVTGTKCATSSIVSCTKVKTFRVKTSIAFVPRINSGFKYSYTLSTRAWWRWTVFPSSNLIRRNILLASKTIVKRCCIMCVCTNKTNKSNSCSTSKPSRCKFYSSYRRNSLINKWCKNNE